MPTPSLEMSVVLVTPGRYEDIRATFEGLRAQTIREQLEIVIVAPSAEKFGFDPAAAAGFQHVQIVEVGPIGSPAEALTAGVRRSTAPVVAITEEHCVPEPGWAEALVAAHQEPWAAVGAAMVNANPWSTISWAEMLLDFGHSLAPAPAGETRHPPSHNTSYKRALLEAYGPALEAMLQSEETLFHDLRARGHRLYLEPAARVRHVNISRLASFLRLEYVGGRVYGAFRARFGHWSLGRRLVYALGAPLFNLARLRYVVRHIQRIGLRRQMLPGGLPVVAAGLLWHGWGEAVGYAFGAGQSTRQRHSFELYRLRHVSSRDRQALTGR